VRPPAIRLFDDELVIDSFAGGGGTSTGLEWALGRSPDLAVNHDARAIAMHQANHPRARHLISNVFDVDWVSECAGRKVALFWLSPDCTYHSVARGGKPFRDRRRANRIRGLAWIAPRVAKLVRPRVIILENVREFEDWGPLLPNGKPCPDRAGVTFRRFVRMLENLGYKVEHRDLTACDYGAPTSRTRLFLVARCDGLPIVWPEPTHGPGRQFPHRTAAECIDWSLDCPSIFERARPLAENTERRIARGYFKYVANGDPFIVPVLHGAEARVWPIDEPMRTITGAHRGDRALVKPYLARIGQTGGHGGYVRSAGAPVSTITTKREHLLVAPTLVTTGYGEDKQRNGGLGQAPRVPGLDKPIGTLVGTRKHALVSAFLTKHFAGNYHGAGAPLTSQLGTITARDHHSLSTSHLISLKGSLDAGTRAGQQVDQPMPVIQAHGLHIGEVRAFLIKYYSEGGQWGAIDKPMGTLTTRERLGLVTVQGEDYICVDIGMRMLVARELYRGQGFPDTYIIDPWISDRVDARGRPMKPATLSQEGQVEMCGNSVPPQLAAAVAGAQFVERFSEMVA
jgi:DNA (cytosine-5)-methyltransferase 1